MAVPRVIHYCWFGGGDLPDSAYKTLESWKKYAPGFEIRCCDEGVFDVNSCEWTRQAYAAKKYAFVADYARFRMLYDYGGIYMDLGSELVKDITPLVESFSPFSAIEESTKTANTGLIAASSPRNPLIASVLERYESMSFHDDAEFLMGNTVNELFTTELEKFGFVRDNRLQEASGWTLLPSCYFNPVYGFGGYHINKKTYSIHRFSASWREPKYRVKNRVESIVIPFVGRRIGQIMGRVIGEIKCYGVLHGLHNIGSAAIALIRKG